MTPYEKEKPCDSERIANKDGQMALHLLCQLPDAAVEDCVNALAANPSSARKRDVYGRTPLFYALKRACSEEVVRIIFEAYPEAVSQSDLCGVNPLYLIFHASKHPNILKFMLEIHPSLALTKINSFAGPDLLQLVCSHWEISKLKSVNEVRCNADLWKLWEKVVLTVQAAHACRHANLRTNFELHAALEVPCSQKMLTWFVRMYPNQLKLPMRDRKLPFHAFITRNDIAKSKETPTLMATFLHHYPEAATIPWERKLPLHLAVESGMTWSSGLDQLLYAFPQALRNCDHKSRLFPFMASCERCDLSTIFSLLREGPEMVS